MKEKTLSIAYFTAQYFPHMGGVEFYTEGLAKALTGKNQQVTIITSEVRSEPMRTEKEGFVILRLPSVQSMGTRYPMLKPGRMFWKMIKELLQEQWDLVLVNTKFYPMSILGAWFAKKKRIPCIVIEHGSAHLRTAGKLTTWITEQAEHFYALWIRLYHPYFAGVSKAACRWLKHFHIKALGPAYNTTDYERIRGIQAQPQEDIREKYGISQDTAIILFAGRLLKQKGLLQLMEAVCSLVAEGEKVVLLVAGEGPLKEEVVSKGVPVVYLGALEFEQLMKIEVQCDIFCLPSETEGFPTALLEAAASHLYVLTTLCGGISEIVPDESFGGVLEDNRQETIKRMLKAAIDDPLGRKEAALRLEKRVKRRFTFTNTAEQILKYGEEIS